MWTKVNCKKDTSAMLLRGTANKIDNTKGTESRISSDASMEDLSIYGFSFTNDK